ncbi:PD-(D/E)XK nuclease family protein [Bacteriovoracales bacterium]|nr:PD-(D/E)XK nuclease family protein [Bacteriovoracales bacterium]
MLDVVLWKSHEDICSLDFLKNENNSIEFICPNPELADELRPIVQKELTFSQAKTVTISNFIQRELRSGPQVESSVKYRFLSKSEILLHLGLLWRKAYPQAPEYLFLKVYTLFSELRSFTLDRNLFLEALELCSGDHFKMALSFWDYFEKNNFMDEQKAYGVLSEFYWDKKTSLSSFSDNLKTYVIWGFDYLSGLQIDLIKAMSESSNVFVPFPLEVYEESSFYDWIRWVLPSNDSSDEQLNFSDYGPLEVISSEKESLGLKLKNYLKDCGESIDFIIADDKMNYSDINIIPFENISFKHPSDLFSPILEEEIKKLYENFFIRTSSETEEYDLGDLEKYLKEKLQIEILKEDTEKSFRQIKVLCLLMKNFTKLGELLDIEGNKKLDSYFFYLIKSISELELPRNFSFPLIGNSTIGKIKSLKQFDSIESKKLNVLIVTDEHDPFKKTEDIFSEDLYSFLSAIGPLKRGSLNSEINKSKIKEILKKRSILLIESSALNNEPFWKEFAFNEIIEKKQDKKISKSRNYLGKKIKKELIKEFVWSPSSLQIFYDCPRKFYFKYVEGINHRFSPKEHLGYDQKGIIEHKIIGAYLSKFRIWNDKEFKSIVEKTLNDHLNEKDITLDIFDYKRNILEIENFSRRGISSLLMMGEEVNDLGLSFEFEPQKKFKDKKVKGVIDLLVESGDGQGILDFKRSKGGIPTIKEFLDFNHIQIWFYLSNFDIDLGKLKFFGFLNLEDLQSSLIYYRPELLDSSVQNEFKKFLKETKAKKWDSLISENINSYLNFEKKLILKSYNEKKFNAKPRLKKICNFCEYKNVCEKQ